MPRRGSGEAAPQVTVTPLVRTGAGTPAPITVTITNRAAEPRVFAVSALGVDSAWVPAPSRSTVVAPGQSVAASLLLQPADGTLPARYPLSVVVQALDPVTGQPTSPGAVTGLELVVDAPGQVAVALDPPDTRAVYSKRIAVVLQNTGSTAENVHLDARSPFSTAVDLNPGPHLVPPGSSLRVPARVTVTRPTLFRRDSRHAFSVTARTAGAPRYTQGSLTARSVIGPTGAKVIAVVAVIAVWVALALIFVPRLADSVKKHGTEAGATQTLTVKPSGAGKSGGAGGSGGSGGGGAAPDGSGSGGSGSGSSSGGAAAGASASKKIQLNGTVGGAAPSGVTVQLSPSPFGAQGDSTSSGGASTAGNSASSGPIGKLTGDAVATTALPATTQRSITTGADGAWSFVAVAPVGFYQLQFSKPGYETQRFVVDPTSATASDPMAVTLVPGTGSLHGIVRDASGGVVGAATIVITDGTNTLTTSSVSKGPDAGTWSVTGLSTPSTYLVSASHDGLGTASTLVQLAASGSATTDLRMLSDQATLAGYVHRFVDGRDTGVGAAQVTATDGTTTRTASTVTTGSGTGNFVLPDLTLGTWVVTVQADGYQTQTRKVVVSLGGRRLPRLLMGLNLSTVTVRGQVFGADRQHPLTSAGVTLADETNTYKTTSLAGGGFRIDGVAPGTYTLGVEYSGYDPAYLSVQAVIGKATHFARVVLPVHVSHSDSSIVGYVGNAVASSGSIGCAKVVTKAFPDGVPCSVAFALSDSAGNTVPVSVTDNGANSGHPSQGVAKNGPTSYTLQSNLADGEGLQPGHYTLTISSFGYIPATIGVDVPLDGTAAAPQVSLFPANALSGRVDAVGSINGDGTADPANPTPGANCVLAIPVAYDEAPVTPNNFVCRQSDVGAGQYGPDFVTAKQHKCTDNGTPEPGYGLILNNSEYKVPGLCDGQYTVSIVAGNATYDQSSFVSTIQTVVHGQTSLFSPHLSRKPVITVHAGKLDTSQLGDPDITVPEVPQPVALAGTALSVSCKSSKSAGTITRTVTTDSTGAADVYGVSAGTVSCDVTPAAGAPTALTDFVGTTGKFSALDDRTTDEQATLVKYLPAKFGRVVSSHDADPVAGAHVTFGAVTSYSGTQAVAGSRDLWTNKNGCFAVVPDSATVDALDADPSSIPAACAARFPAGSSFSTIFPTDATVSPARSAYGVMTLTSRVVTIQAAKTPTTDALASGTAILDDGANSLTAVHVHATSVPIPSAAIQTLPAGKNLALDGATVKVVSAPADAGTISASINRDGQLIWYDSKVAEANKATQGQYTLLIKAPGFQDHTGTMTCGLPSDPTVPKVLACTYDADFRITALATFTGKVVGPSFSDGTTPVPVANAQVFAVPCTDTKGQTTCAVPSDPRSGCATLADGGDLPPYGTTTDQAGRFTFTKNGVRRMLPGQYKLVICAGGMQPFYSDVLDASGDTDLTQAPFTMSLLGAVFGTITDADTKSAVTDASVAMYLCADAACTGRVQLAVTTSDGTGFYQFVSKTSGLVYYLDPGRYLLSVTATGYSPRQVVLDIVGGTRAVDMASQTFTMNSLGGLAGEVVIDNGATPSTSVANASLTLELCDQSGTCSQTASTKSDGSGRYQFTNATGPAFLTTGVWTLIVGADGFQPLTTTVTILNSRATYTVKLKQLGALSGTVTADDGTNSPVANAIVTITSPCSGCTWTTTTGGTGAYTFAGSATNYVLQPGTYTMTIRAAGFSTFTDPDVVVHNGDNTSAPVLSRLAGLSGIISAPDDSPVTNAAVVLKHCDSAGTCIQVAKTTTDGSGTYTMSSGTSPYFLDLTTYQVTVTAAGFQPYSDTTKSLVGGDNEYNAELVRRAGLSGAITAPDDSPVPNAAIVLKHCDSAGTCTQVAKTTTDGSGTYTMSSGTSPYFLDSTTYQVTVTAPGFQAFTGNTDPLVGGDNDFSKKLSRLGGLSGTITAVDDGTPVPNAVVSMSSCTDLTTCLPASPAAYKTTTDGGGSFTFSSGVGSYFLTPNTIWQVTVTAAGFAPGTQTPITVAGDMNTSDITLNRLGSLSGLVKDNQSSGTAVPNASVTARKCADPDCQNLASGANTSYLTTSDPSGSYTFRFAGSANIFDDGSVWQISASATGYQSTSSPITMQVNANSLDLTLTALGRLSGLVTGTGAPNSSEHLSGAQVTASSCNADGTTCATTPTYTTYADINGTFTFAGSGVPYVLALGTWKITASTFGYLPNSVLKTVTSGSNVLASNLDESVRTATQSFTVKMVGGTATTTHAMVQLSRVDDPNTVISTTRSGDVYSRSGLIPGSYHASITGSDNTAQGQSIVPTTATVDIPLVGPASTPVPGAPNDGIAPDQQLFVSVIRNVVTGTVALPTGADKAAVEGIDVQLVSMVPSSVTKCSDPAASIPHNGYCPATDNSDQLIASTTDSDGNYTLGGIPAGTYSVRINGPDPITGAAPDNGYLEAVTSQVSVGYNQTVPAGTQTLTAATQAVTVHVTFDSAEKSAVQAGTGTLTAAGKYSWPTQSIVAPANPVGNTSADFVFNAQTAFGCWVFSLDLGASHPGGVELTSSAGSCTSTGAFQVSKSLTATPATPTYQLDEHQVSVTPTIKLNSVDTVAPAYVVTVTVGGTAVPTTTNGAKTTAYVADGVDVHVAVTPPSTVTARLWPQYTTTISSIAASTALAPTITEVAYGSISTRGFSVAANPPDPAIAASSTNSLTVEVACQPASPDECANVPDPSPASGPDTGSGVVFADLAPGTWLVTVSGGSIPLNTSYTQTLTVTPGSPALRTNNGAWKKVTS